MNCWRSKSAVNWRLNIATGSNLLTLALGTPEHSGRVRGVGGFITPKRFFGLPKQRRVAITKAELLARDKERDRKLIETKKLLAESEAKTQELINKAIVEFSSRLTSSQGGTPLADARAPITPIFDNFSTYDVLHHQEFGLDVNADVRRGCSFVWFSTHWVMAFVSSHWKPSPTLWPLALS